MRAAAQTVLTLCQDKRYMGAKPAILAVLHTWTARIDYHPHVHLLVSGGGIADGGKAWCEAKHPFLIPVRAASPMLRGKFRAMLDKRQPGLCAQQPKAAWSKKWVVWCKHWGQGETAVLDYLGRYVHRIAITNTRIVAMDEKSVTFRYKERKKSRWRTATMSGHEFMRRFLQHVLPKGFHKVRYYGLWNPKQREAQRNARRFLELAQGTNDGPLPAEDGGAASGPQNPIIDIGDAQTAAAPVCPRCGKRRAVLVATVLPSGGLQATRASPEAA